MVKGNFVNGNVLNFSVGDPISNLESFKVTGGSLETSSGAPVLSVLIPATSNAGINSIAFSASPNIIADVIIFPVKVSGNSVIPEATPYFKPNDKSINTKSTYKLNNLNIPANSPVLVMMFVIKSLTDTDTTAADFTCGIILNPKSSSLYIGIGIGIGIGALLLIAAAAWYYHKKKKTLSFHRGHRSVRH
jgi:hypothetical protein